MSYYCSKKYGKPNATKKIVSQLENFCVLLRGNKVKDGKIAFLKFPLSVQCLFLQYSWEIISRKSKYSDDSYLTAFKMFKLFRGKEMQGKPIYKKFLSLKTVETHYKKALDWNRKQSGSPSPKGRTVSKTTPGGRTTSGAQKVSKKYSKTYQKFAEPESEVDPLYIYYTSLYEQIPKARLSVTWLTEHGVYDGSKREKLVKQYEKLVASNQLLK